MSGILGRGWKTILQFYEEERLKKKEVVNHVHMRTYVLGEPGFLECFEETYGDVYQGFYFELQQVHFSVLGVWRIAMRVQSWLCYISVNVSWSTISDKVYRWAKLDNPILKKRFYSSFGSIWFDRNCDHKVAKSVNDDMHDVWFFLWRRIDGPFVSIEMQLKEGACSERIVL